MWYFHLNKSRLAHSYWPIILFKYYVSWGRRGVISLCIVRTKSTEVTVERRRHILLHFYAHNKWLSLTLRSFRTEWASCRQSGDALSIWLTLARQRTEWFVRVCETNSHKPPHLNLILRIIALITRWQEQHLFVFLPLFETRGIPTLHASPLSCKHWGRLCRRVQAGALVDTHGGPLHSLRRLHIERVSSGH